VAQEKPERPAWYSQLRKTAGIRDPKPLTKIIQFYRRAIHSTDIKIPAGNGITCGALLAGAFSGKNSL